MLVRQMEEMKLWINGRAKALRDRRLGDVLPSQIVDLVILQHCVGGVDIAHAVQRAKPRISFNPILGVHPPLCLPEEILDLLKTALVRRVAEVLACPFSDPDRSVSSDGFDFVDCILETLNAGAVIMEGNEVDLATFARFEEVLEPFTSSIRIGDCGRADPIGVDGFDILPPELHCSTDREPSLTWMIRLVESQDVLPVFPHDLRLPAPDGVVPVAPHHGNELECIGAGPCAPRVAPGYCR